MTLDRDIVCLLGMQKQSKGISTLTTHSISFSPLLLPPSTPSVNMSSAGSRFCGPVRSLVPAEGSPAPLALRLRCCIPSSAVASSAISQMAELLSKFLQHDICAGSPAAYLQGLLSAAVWCPVVTPRLQRRCCHLQALRKHPPAARHSVC